MSEDVTPIATEGWICGTEVGHWLGSGTPIVSCYGCGAALPANFPNGLRTHRDVCEPLKRKLDQ